MHRSIWWKHTCRDTAKPFLNTSFPPPCRVVSRTLRDSWVQFIQIKLFFRIFILHQFLLICFHFSSYIRLRSIMIWKLKKREHYITLDDSHGQDGNAYAGCFLTQNSSHIYEHWWFRSSEACDIILSHALHSAPGLLVGYHITPVSHPGL